MNSLLSGSGGWGEKIGRALAVHRALARPCVVVCARAFGACASSLVSLAMLLETEGMELVIKFGLQAIK